MRVQTLEKYQVFFYLAAVATGLIAGSFPGDAPALLAPLLWPLLALLLYATFTQVPLRGARRDMLDVAFLKAAVLGNFVIIPGLVWGLLQFLPEDPAIRLGVLLVLLVPCTDWFITFSHLGRGDARSALAFAPVSLLLQILLLPLYLWLFLGEGFAITMARREMALAFLLLIVLPLLAALLTQRRAGGVRLQQRLALLPVPLLALVVFIIALTQVQLVTGSWPLLGQLLLVFAVFLGIAGLLSRILARAFQLPVSRGRVLAFSFGTRNSFVVLPIALALPDGFQLAVVAVVFQSLVELLGMAFYLWWVPRVLFPGGAGRE